MKYTEYIQYQPKPNQSITEYEQCTSFLGCIVLITNRHFLWVKNPGFIAFIDEVVQERLINSIALAMELRLSCARPSLCHMQYHCTLHCIIESIEYNVVSLQHGQFSQKCSESLSITHSSPVTPKYGATSKSDLPYTFAITALNTVLGLVFYLWLWKVLANERRYYICNIFSHWLRPGLIEKGCKLWMTMLCWHLTVFSVFSEILTVQYSIHQPIVL